jgi:hypothetical protein
MHGRTAIAFTGLMRETKPRCSSIRARTPVLLPLTDSADLRGEFSPHDWLRTFLRANPFATIRSGSTGVHLSRVSSLRLSDSVPAGFAHGEFDSVR